MNRREFMEAGAALPVSDLGSPVVPEKGGHPISPPPPAFHDQASKLKITGVRMVRPQPRKPMPRCEPAPESWSTRGALVANPMSIYLKYKARRDLFMADDLGPRGGRDQHGQGLKGSGLGDRDAAT